MGRGGASVEAMTQRRVVGSTPALAATWGPWASPLPIQLPMRFGVKLRYSIRAVDGSASE